MACVHTREQEEEEKLLKWQIAVTRLGRFTEPSPRIIGGESAVKCDTERRHASLNRTNLERSLSASVALAKTSDLYQCTIPLRIASSVVNSCSFLSLKSSALLIAPAPSPALLPD